MVFKGFHWNTYFYSVSFSDSLRPYGECPWTQIRLSASCPHDCHLVVHVLGFKIKSFGGQVTDDLVANQLTIKLFFKESFCGRSQVGNGFGKSRLDWNRKMWTTSWHSKGVKVDNQLTPKHIYMYIHTYIHTYIYIYINIYIYIFICMHSPRVWSHQLSCVA